MPTIAVMSLKSGGVTTLCQALGTLLTTALSPAVVVEADPCGGVLAARHRLSTVPGIVEAAAAARIAQRPPDVLRDFIQPVTIAGIEMGLVVAPPDPAQTRAALAVLTRGRILNPDDRTVIVDCGRLDATAGAFDVARVADVVLVMVRGRLEEVALLQTRAEDLARASDHVVLVLAPGGVYPAAEVADALGEAFGITPPIRGPLPVDEHSARVFNGDACAGRHFHRRPLPAAVDTLAADVVLPLLGTARQVHRHHAPTGPS